ncbi:MAG: PepSY domain-containing protein [Desulfocapsaceae bacterium]|nr:PepSY domain-containing protein [Desulfocapsaceae bacterium]
MKRNVYLIALAVLSSTAFGRAYAVNVMGNDALAIQTAKISLTQAIVAAEQNAAGKASRAEFEKHKGQWVFVVEVVSNKKVMDVRVDPESGKVLAATEDEADRDNKHDKED